MEKKKKKDTSKKAWKCKHSLQGFKKHQIRQQCNILRFKKTSTLSRYCSRIKGLKSRWAALCLYSDLTFKQSDLSSVHASRESFDEQQS